MKVLKKVNHLSDQVCELLKSLYRLKQSANLWNKKIIKTLKFLEFEQILTDISVFIHSHSIIVTLYIDNMLILEKNLKKVKQVKNEIKKLHVIKNLNSISKILEIHMTHQINNFIKIDQDHYIQQVLAEFDMKHAKQALMSLSSSLNLESQDTQLLNVKAHKIYKWMIKRMMFMIIETQINIAITVNWLS